MQHFTQKSSKTKSPNRNSALNKDEKNINEDCIEKKKNVCIETAQKSTRSSEEANKQGIMEETWKAIGQRR